MIEYIRDRVPVYRTEASEIARSTVQTGTWLVGLSAGFLALVAANPTVSSAMPRETRSLLGFLLLVSVAAGVLQRMLFQASQEPQWLLLSGLRSFMDGLKNDAVEPTELGEEWDREEIIKQMQATFGLDYDFLREYDVPIDGCRDAYVSQYTIWQKADVTRREELGVLVMAYEGKTADESRRALFPSPDFAGKLEQIRKKARLVKRLQVASTVCFYVAGASFVAALVLVAQAI